MSKLYNLSSNFKDSFLSLYLHDQVQLVLVGKRQFVWDSNIKSPNINLLNGNLTAYKFRYNEGGERDYESVLGNVEMN